MSDPMTNTEVEDVLASIRRLVSDDKRPESEPAQAAATDRLVLTPSLRVMDDDNQDAPADPETEEARDAELADVETSRDEGEAAADDTDVSVEAEVEADIAQMSIHDAFATEAEETSAEAAPDSGEEDTSVSDETAEEHQEAAASDVPFESVEDETAEGDEPEDAEQAEVIEAAHVEAAEDAATDNAEPEQTLSDKIAALETLIGGRDEEFEPDDPGTDEYAGTEPPAMSWEDADEAPAYGAFMHAQATPDEDSQAQIFSSDEDVLDEEALRELVSDIVREELQGALGERITRNVRKLVRREIHRALAAQELE